jgi:imidazolonepropionase-like amidohydrolase
MIKEKIVFILGLCFVNIFISSGQLSDNVKAFVKYNEPAFAITHVTLIDGTGHDPQDNMTVVVTNGVITHVSPDDQVSVVKGVFMIDGSGMTLIPGFVMLHEHIFYTKIFEGDFNIVNMTNTFPRMYLAGGVTTMRTGGCVSPYDDLNIKKLINDGKMLGPSMDVTAPFIERENNFDIPQLPILPEGVSAGAMVDFWAKMGCTSFKTYMHITKKDLTDVVHHAHTKGLKVTGHLCSIRYREAAEIGIDNLEHGFMVCSDFVDNINPEECDDDRVYSSLLALDKDDPRMDSLMKYLISKDVTLTTTLAVFAPYTDYELILGGGEQALHPDILARVKSSSVRGMVHDDAETLLFNKELYWIKKFYNMGGKVCVGTDPTGSGRTIAGYANIWTLETLIKNGFTPSQAVQLCTLKGAEYLNQQFEKGSIQKAKSADMILMKGNLTTDPDAIRHIECVFKNGVGYDSKRIFESVKGKVGLY